MRTPKYEMPARFMSRIRGGGAQQRRRCDRAVASLRQLRHQAVASLGVDELEREVTLLGRFDRHLLLAPGEAVEVAIDPRLLHFFDLETGVSVPAVVQVPG